MKSSWHKLSKVKDFGSLETFRMFDINFFFFFRFKIFKGLSKSEANSNFNSKKLMGLIKNLASGKLFYIKMEILFFAKDVVCSFDKNEILRYLLLEKVD